MKVPITIKFNNGEEATYVVNPADFRLWELKSGKTIRDTHQMGINDYLTLAYQSMLRTSVAKQHKNYETWCLTIDDIELGDANPKAIQPEA